MSHSSIGFRDRLAAEALTLGSAIQVRVPAARKLTENEETLAQPPIRWRHARIAVDNVVRWLTVSGNPSAGRTPKDYPEKLVVTALQDEVDARNEAFPGKHALAYTLGSAVMIGLATRGELFDMPDSYPPLYRKDMGIGPGPLQTALGIWYPKERQLWTPTTMMAGERYSAADPPPPSI